MISIFFWLKIWMFFCLGLFCIYLIFRFFEYIDQILWIKEIKKKHLLIKKHKKFRKKYGEKVSYIKFKEIIEKMDFKSLAERPAWFELFEHEKIVFFEIPWGEIYCECTNDEYNELIQDIGKQQGQPSRLETS